jgi:1-acyl-sn-glycerol-3-phosphate acyltransferase
MIRSVFKPFHYVYVVYAFLLFAVLMIPVFIWALFAMFFGRIRSGNMIYSACIVWADIWCFCIGINHRNIFKGKHLKHRSFIYVSNHISYLDSALIPKTLRHPVRPLGKVEMSKIPIFGFIYKKVIVSVDRSSVANRARSVEELKAMLRNGISILVFPEGTFNMTHQPLKHFYDGAFRIAIETGTSIRPMLLLDTYDRMHYNSIFSLNPGKSRALFLEEVPVTGLTLDDVSSLRQKVYDRMEEAILHYKASWAVRTEKISN